MNNYHFQGTIVGTDNKKVMKAISNSYCNGAYILVEEIDNERVNK